MQKSKKNNTFLYILSFLFIVTLLFVFLQKKEYNFYNITGYQSSDIAYVLPEGEEYNKDFPTQYNAILHDLNMKTYTKEKEVLNKNKSIKYNFYDRNDNLLFSVYDYETGSYYCFVINNIETYYKPTY